MNYFLVDFEKISTDDMKNLDGVRGGDTIVMFFSENRKNISLDFIEEVLKKGANFKTMKVSAGSKNALDFQLTSYLGYLIGKFQGDSEYIIVSHDTGYDCLKSFWKNMDIKVRRASFSGADAKKKAKAVQPNNPAAANAKPVPNKAATAQPGKQAKKQESVQPGSQPETAQQSQMTQKKETAPKSTAPTESTGKKKAAKKSKVASKDLATIEEISTLVSEEENPSEILSIVNQYKTKTSIANGLSKLYKDTKKASVVYKKLKPLLKEKNKS